MTVEIGAVAFCMGAASLFIAVSSSGLRDARMTVLHGAGSRR